ncbi:MAG: PASTA domain-containing protein [Sphingomonas bacterium]
MIIREKQDDAYCPDKPKAETPEGRWAVARGWRISSERKLGQLVAVNVVRHLEHDVGGLCISIDGQFLLFDHGRPIASVMTVSEYGYQLGFLSETERGGFRIESGLKEPPFGDLFVKGDDIDIEPLPPSETWCDGKKPVPNIFGKPIQEARKILRRAGWKPVPRYRRLPAIGDDGKGDIFSGEDYLYHDGVTEVVGCEPRGQCWLDYRSGQATAEILTQGEHVTNYGVDCDDRRSEARAGT